MIAGLRLKHRAAYGYCFDEAGREVAVIHRTLTTTEFDRSKHMEACFELGNLAVVRGCVYSVVDVTGRAVMRIVGPHDVGTKAMWLLGPGDEELGVIAVACSPTRRGWSTRFSYPLFVDGACRAELDDPCATINMSDGTQVRIKGSGIINARARVHPPVPLTSPLVGLIHLATGSTR